MYWMYSYIYKVKDSKLKVEFWAREDSTVQEMIRLISKLVHNPPSKLIKKKKITVDKPPYEIEQATISKFRKQCKERGIDPDE